MIFHHSKIEFNFELLGIFIYSIPLDLSTAAYLSSLPLIIYLFYRIFKKKEIYYTTLIIVIIELLCSSFIHCSELIVYEEWKHKLSSKVFLHLFSGNEIIRTADTLSIIWFSLLLIFEFTFGFILLRYIFLKHAIAYHFKGFKMYILYPTFLVLELGLSLIFARGGFQQIPINIDAAYYSKSFILNDISINSTYFFANSYFLYLNSDIERFVPKINSEYARSHADSLYMKNHFDRFDMLTSTQPNIVLIILEGWSASALDELSNLSKYNSRFEDLRREGIYFDNIFATNTTSEIGHTSILAGFPSLSEVAISQYPEKHRKLKTLNQILATKNYSSSYIFGGDIKYGNIESFIVDHGIEKITDEDDFPTGMSHGKLSYHDEDVFNYFLRLQRNQNEPFFSVIFTGSTHSPYDYPKNDLYQWSGKESKYMNSLIYAENALCDFIEQCKVEQWYDNTLFVIVSDHSHSSPKYEIPYESGYFKIPFLLFGNTLKSELLGSIIHTIGSQADIPATILSQLNLPSQDFPFSKDLCNPLAHHFAMLSTIRGYGYVNTKGSFMYQFDYDKFNENSFNNFDFDDAKKESDVLFRSYYDYYNELDFKQ